MINNTPNSKQLYFFMMPEETRKVLEFIVEQNCIIYSDRSISAEPCECSSLVGLSQVFFCPQELSEGIKMHKSSGGVFFIEPTTSPVIELGCSVLRDIGLSRGRIYFRGGYDGREGWVTYPETLYEAFMKITSFMKKTFLTKERKYGASVSKGAQSYVSGGGCLRQ